MSLDSRDLASTAAVPGRRTRRWRLRPRCSAASGIRRGWRSCVTWPSGSNNVRDLTEHLGLAQSTVSAHLRCPAGLRHGHRPRQGRASVYALAAQQQTLAVLVAAEHLLAATGDAVTFCPVYGTGSQMSGERP